MGPYVASVFEGTTHVRGKASGTLIASGLELSFWGGVNSQTGEVIDRHHDLSGHYLQDTVLAIPGGRGSCSGSGVMLELLLNNKGPKAILFERQDDILTLGVMVAEEIFGKAIPVVTMKPNDFRAILGMRGKTIYIDSDRVSDAPFHDTHCDHTQEPTKNYFIDGMQLSDFDKELLQGVHGEASCTAIRIILRMASLLGATELMNVTQVHVDCCLYTGPGSLLFAEKLRDWGGKVRVPTTLNSISIDQNRWREQGVGNSFGEAATKLANAYTDMGATPTFTCAPYQLKTAPRQGEQVAWAESNAVVYANSVLGARTMKYPDFLDICIALTGRAPRGGAHLDINRLASLILRVGLPDVDTIDDSFYPILGYKVGSLAANRIPVIVGLQTLAPSRDDLKAFGAAFATVSSAPMFHMLGVTPEATSLSAVVDEARQIPSVDIKMEHLIDDWQRLNSASEQQAIDLVSLGNPHFSFKEMKRLAHLCEGRTKAQEVSVIVTCGRSSYGLASQAGVVELLENFGVKFMTDTCWCMITEPIVPATTNAIMTNSAKYAHYGPGLTGRKFFFGSLMQCVEAACRTSYTKEMPQWLLNTDD
jgi:predicted aconitase/predicted aconitase with swiveling domain